MADQITIDPNGHTKPKRTGLIIGGAIVLVILLAGAAFVGGQLLNQQQTNDSKGGLVVNGGPGGGQQVSVQAERAKELPDAKPDVNGLFASRKDNSIFVTQGDRITVMVGKDGAVNSSTDGNGAQIEIVVTADTKIYKDVTQPPDVNSASGTVKVQQQVAPGSLDEIGDNSVVSAWGDRRGDRLIANILLYEQPMLINLPGKAGP